MGCYNSCYEQKSWQIIVSEMSSNLGYEKIVIWQLHIYCRYIYPDFLHENVFMAYIYQQNMVDLTKPYTHALFGTHSQWLVTWTHWLKWKHIHIYCMKMKCSPAHHYINTACFLYAFAIVITVLRGSTHSTIEDTTLIDWYIIKQEKTEVEGSLFLYRRYFNITILYELHNYLIFW